MMTTTYRTYLFVIFLFAIVSLQCNPKSRQKEERKTGLIYLDPVRYKNLTEASNPFGANENLPTFLDYSSDLPPVRNQGNQMSCVAWATAYALKFYEEKKENNSNVEFSPSFIYNQINNGRDGGSNFVDALNVLSQQGAALWNDMPYDEKDYLSKPSETAKQNAKPYGIANWRKVNTADMKEIKMQLNAGYPVIIGADIDEDFRAGRPNRGGEYFYSKRGGADAGSHAMLVVGFDDAKSAFKVMNSWGPNWGNSGFCWIDYRFFQEIVKEGYIAFDKKTELAPNTTPNNNPVVNNNTTVTDPAQFAKAILRNVQVQHNVMDNTYGYCMKISGYIDIPAGVGKTFQIGNHFFLSNSVQQAKSLMSPTFADVNGFAATGSILYSVPAEGLKNYYWECLMPYKALELPFEITYFYFVPTLFIDNFGYAKGDAVNFSVNKKYL